MFVDTLDHCNICTPRFDETIDFYTRVMRLKLEPSEIGDDAQSTGHWAAFLRDPGGRAIIHVVGLNKDSQAYVLKNNLAHRRREDTDPACGLDHLTGSGALDHIAFDCTNFPEALETFKSNKVPFRYFRTQRTGIHQLFVRDPNGIVLELNFPRDEVPQNLVKDLSKGAMVVHDSAA